MLNRLGYRVFSLLNRLVPKVADPVVLHSTIDLEDGVLAVVEGLAARGRRATVLVEDPARAERVRAAVLGARVRTVRRRSVRGVLSFLRSRFVFTTENLYGSPVPPRTQTVVNIWHGEPPGKSVGRFQPGRSGIVCSYAPVCSTVSRAYRSAEFGLHPLRVPIVGAPRNDRMLRSDGAAVRNALLGSEARRPTLLWLPSVRTGRWGDRVRVDVAPSHPGLPYAPQELVRLDDWLTARGARIVVKLHPHDVEHFPEHYRSLVALRQEDLHAQDVTLYPALPAFDGLITDLSSVRIDYLLLDKPLVFAFPDVDEYRDGRGLDVEPYEQWVPGPFARTIDELIAAVSDVIDGKDPMREERARARLRFHLFHDDRSTERLLDGLALT